MFLLLKSFHRPSSSSPCWIAFSPQLSWQKFALPSSSAFTKWKKRGKAELWWILSVRWPSIHSCSQPEKLALLRSTCSVPQKMQHTFMFFLFPKFLIRSILVDPPVYISYNPICGSGLRVRSRVQPPFGRGRHESGLHHRHHNSEQYRIIVTMATEANDDTKHIKTWSKWWFRPDY